MNSLQKDKMDKWTKGQMVTQFFYRNHAGFFGQVPAVFLHFLCKYAHIFERFANFQTKKMQKNRT